MTIVKSCSVHVSANDCIEQINNEVFDGSSDGYQISPFRPCLLQRDKGPRLMSILSQLNPVGTPVCYLLSGYIPSLSSFHDINRRRKPIHIFTFHIFSHLTKHSSTSRPSTSCLPSGFLPKYLTHI